MKQRLQGFLGGWRRRSLFAGALAVIAGGAFAISALAVHELKFQLDGNALSSVCGTTPDGNCSIQVFDWGGSANC